MEFFPMKIILPVCFSAFMLNDAWGWGVKTHVKLTDQAINNSSVESVVRNQLSIVSLNETLVSIDTAHSIADWITLGAEDEDNTVSANLARYRNHFFDPQHGGSGFSFRGVTGEPMPDWALEDKGTYASQEYSLKSARRYYYDAVTLPDKANREMYLARTFYTLGHVAHLIQDAAQPQHTRNDAHGGFIIFGEPSLYEIYTADNGGALSTFDGINETFFLDPRSYWFTGEGNGLAEISSNNFVSFGTNFSGAFQNGQLVVEPNKSFPFPTPHPTPSYIPADGLLTSVGVPVPIACQAPNSPCYIKFFGSDGRMGRNNGWTNDASIITNPLASTASLFDQDLQANGVTVSYPNLDKCVDPKDPASCEQVSTSQVFSLNRFNFDVANQFLMPKAVAYTTSLFDNFFATGRIFFFLNYYNGFPYTYRKFALEEIEGTFELFYDDANGTRYPIPEMTWRGLIANYNGRSPTLTPPAQLANYPVRFITVFRGRVGAKSDVVVVGASDWIGRNVEEPIEETVKSAAWSGSCWFDITTHEKLSTGQYLIRTERYGHAGVQEWNPPGYFPFRHDGAWNPVMWATLDKKAPDGVAPGITDPTQECSTRGCCYEGYGDQADSTIFKRRYLHWGRLSTRVTRSKWAP